MSNVAKNLKQFIGAGTKQAYASHLQASGTVERENKTLITEFACFVAAGHGSWEKHVALTWFMYGTGVCPSTGMARSKQFLE